MKHYFKYYCKDYENIENYEKALKDNFKGWNCHHRLETHNSDGERRLVDISAAELIALGMYYNRPANELLFMTTSEHKTLHMKGKYAGENNPFYGKTHSDESKNKMSEAHKGKHNSAEHNMKISEARKGKKLSEETKKKLSRVNRGKKLSDETKNKIAEAQKGRLKGTFWYNNSKINVRAKECPDGFVPGRINSMGRHWYNNGKENKFCFECPEGFVAGMLK